MSTAVAVSVADALVAMLNAASLSQEFTAVRKLIPKYTLEELDTLRVTVVVRAVEPSLITRGHVTEDYTIDVAVQKKINPDTPGVSGGADALMYLVEEIRDLLLGERLTTYSDAMCTAITSDPLARPDHLVSDRVFTSLIGCKYNVVRAA